MRLEDTLRERSDARFLVAGDLVLDREDQRAWLTSKVLDLPGKPMLLLEELMRRPGLLVTKDRLLEVGWPGQATSDAVLTTAIRDLRRALGDPARAPEWIETQHGEGIASSNRSRNAVFIPDGRPKSNMFTRTVLAAIGKSRSVSLLS